MTGTHPRHTPANEVFVRAAQRLLPISSCSALFLGPNKHRLMWTRRFLTTSKPFTLNSQLVLECIPWHRAEHSSLTAESQAKPAEKHSSPLFPFGLEEQIWEKLQGTTQPGQAKPMKCSVLSACFNFPEKLLNALHFFPFLLHTAAMHVGDLSARHPKGY